MADIDYYSNSADDHMAEAERLIGAASELTGESVTAGGLVKVQDPALVANVVAGLHHLASMHIDAGRFYLDRARHDLLMAANAQHERSLTLQQQNEDRMAAILTPGVARDGA